MGAFLLSVALFLLVNILAGLARVARGPTPSDRLLAAQLFGTTGVATLLLLAEAMNEPALRDVGLVFALLAIVATSVFARGGVGTGSDRRGGKSWG